MNRLKTIGDRQHPCLGPLLTLYQSVVKLLTLEQEDTGEYKDLTALSNLSAAPALDSLSHKICLFIIYKVMKYRELLMK